MLPARLIRALGVLANLFWRSKRLKRYLKLNSLSSRLLYTMLLMFLCGGISLAQSQNPSTAPEDRELSMTELLKLPGKVVAAGTNTKGVGKFKVTTYRVEEIALPRASEVEINGKNVQVSKAFRLTIIGGPFEVRALPPVVWLDDVAVGYGVENEDLDAITAVTFDASLLREGASIYLSYGDKKNKEDRVELPEKLKFKVPGAKEGDQ